MPRGNFGRPLIGRPVVWSRVSKCPWAMYWIPNWLLAIGVSVPECKTLKSLCGSERCYKSPLMWLSGTCNWSPDRTISISVENGSRTKMGLLSMWTEWQQIPGVFFFNGLCQCYYVHQSTSLSSLLHHWFPALCSQHVASRNNRQTRSSETQNIPCNDSRPNTKTGRQCCTKSRGTSLWFGQTLLIRNWWTMRQNG